GDEPTAPQDEPAPESEVEPPTADADETPVVDPATAEARALVSADEPMPGPRAAREERHGRSRGKPRRGWFAPLSPEEQAQLRRFLLRWTRPGCGLGLTFALTLALWAWAVVHPQPVLWLLGALLTPWTTPIVGAALGLVLGSRAVLRRAVGMTLVLGLAAWLVGFGVGAAVRSSGRDLPSAAVALAAPDMTAFVVTLVAAVWATVLLARRRAAALLPGAALTWTVGLPLFWAGVYLAAGDGQAASWALTAFATHLFWAWVLAGVTLIFLGLYPSSWGGYGLLALFFALGVLTFLLYAEADLQRRVSAPAPMALAPQPARPAAVATPRAEPSPNPTPTPSPHPSPTPSPRPSPTFTPTPAAAVATYTVEWPTPTPSPTLTPMYAVVRTSARYAGIYVREGPGYGYKAFTGLLNGTQVEVLPEEVEADGTRWVKVRFEEFGKIKEGWVLYHLLIFVTPTATPLD
ncbi:MAG: SH3 domain-containing protein, partial [Chloroflexi bacterium]|nr:SH3 domain-containing protein [Chloroflexota bacterium]